MSTKFNELLKASFKSEDTEEWLDIHFNRPIGLCWALFFKKIHVHPNIVTIMSMILGAASGFMFYYHDIVHNIAGILLLMFANFYDSADGQLARLTNQKTLVGRMLDGLSSDVWYVFIYVAVAMRMMNDTIPFTSVTWGLGIWVIIAYSGLVGHSRQCALADYYRNIHLFFLKGKEGSELDSFKQQREIHAQIPKKGNFWQRAFIWGYGNYCKGQERRTPEFQKFRTALKAKYPNYQDIPSELRADFREGSFPLMKYTNMLTFNVRSIIMYIAFAIDMPWIYFLCEIVIFNIMYVGMRVSHEKMCHRLRLKHLEENE
jgi:phosphatidylglycerophosphate synthase